MSFAERVPYAKAGEAGREAMLRLLAENVAPSVLKVGSHLIMQLSSYSRLAEPVRLSQVAESLGMARETVSRALNILSKLNVIAWKAGMARAKSWVALALEYLPGSTSPSHCDDRQSHSTVSTVVTPRRVVVNEKKETTRERDPLPDVNNSDSVPSDDETLSPEETQEVLAALASSELSQHLFHGLPDRWTRTQMYRRFCRVPMEYLQEVLADSLRGKPARTVDCPHAYAVAWISTAERNVQQRHGQLLTTSPAKG